MNNFATKDVHEDDVIAISEYEPQDAILYQRSYYF